jgi:ABC-type transporter Mla subunit MlaD
VGVVVLGAGVLFQRTILVETVTTESVEGLDVGAAVKFRGVPIGTVTKIEPARWRYRNESVEQRLHLGNQIILECAIDSRVFGTTDMDQIRQTIAESAEGGLRARVASSGLTGPQYVEMVFLDPQDYPAMPLTWQPDKPYVPSAPSSISQVLANLESVATSLRRANLEKVVGHVDELVVDADKAANDLQMPALRSKVVALIDDVHESNGRLHEVLENPDIDRTLKNLSDATGSAKELLGLLATERQDIEVALVNLRRVLENVAALSGDLKDNPSRAFFGQPPPHLHPGD